MAREFPGATATDFLRNSTATGAEWVFNTNVGWWVIFWMNALSSSYGLFGHMGAGNRGTIGGVYVTGVLAFNKEGNGGIIGTSITQPTTGEWYAVQCQSTTGGNGKFKRYRYSNSTLTEETITDTLAINIPIDGDDLTIGNYNSQATNLAFDGIIDRVLYFQGDPSGAEFTAWARAGTIPGSITNKGYWILSPLGAGSPASPEVDSSGNGNDLTVTGTTASAAFVLPDLGQPTIVGVSAAMAVTATSGTNITPAFPAGYTAVADDIVVILAHHSANGPFNTPLAYAIASDGIETLDDNNTAAQRVTVFWHRLVAGDIAQPLVLTTNTSTAVRGAILFIIRGCRTTGNPFEVCKRLLNAAAVTISFPSVTTTLENAFLLALGAYEDDPSNRTTPTDWSGPAGSTFISALGNDMSLNYFARVLASPATAAAFTTTVSTGTFANSPSVGAILAFVPPSEAAAASLIIPAGVARRIGQLY
jgi:hypothetical protein